MRQYEQETTEKYKQAVWDFLLEHCDVLDSGTLFVKFHTRGRLDFEKRVKARWLYNYHREDVRAKEAKADGLNAERKARKLEKKKRYERNKQRGARKLRVRKMLELARRKCASISRCILKLVTGNTKGRK